MSISVDFGTFCKYKSRKTNPLCLLLCRKIDFRLLFWRHWQVEIDQSIDERLGVVNCRLGQLIDFVVDDVIDKITGRVDLGGINMPRRCLDLKIEIEVIVVHPL